MFRVAWSLMTNIRDSESIGENGIPKFGFEPTVIAAEKNQS